MGMLSVIADYSDVIIAVVNIVLVFFVLIQIRDSRKPLLITKVSSGKKDIKDPPDVLETGTLYLTISNISRNLARDIEVVYCFSFDGRSVKITEKKLSYLNPNEATRIVLKYGKIIKNYPDLFDEVKEGNSIQKIPKETLKIDTKLTIAHTPVFWHFFKYKLEDTYFIEWGSLKTYPQLKNHPVVNSWNKRNDEFYIYKTSDAQTPDKS